MYSPYAMLNYTGLKNINTYSGTYTIRLQQDFSFLLRNLALNIQGAYSNSSYFEETRSVKPDMYWAERRDENGNLEQPVPEILSSGKSNLESYAER